MYRYTEEDQAIIRKARKANKDKRAEKRLYALELRASGKSAEEVASAAGFHPAYITQGVYTVLTCVGFSNPQEASSVQTSTAASRRDTVFYTIRFSYQNFSTIPQSVHGI